ncbi:phage tail protein [Lacticaseibacillus daqingensis]|uniref:phage tail protein n=1 Tax=Lacticaseibacillus daqingensis TaxID=2486014 RepID=UPI000F76AAF1|nr:phage tail protein [Lacticaseibacillus daqingensis]
MQGIKYGITYNGLHSYRDFGLTVTAKTVGFPERTPVLLRPPYSNKPIDLSNLYGHTVFGDRALKVEFLIRDFKTMTKQGLSDKLTLVANWLESSMGRTPLYDDVAPAYYYLGEPVTALDWAEMRAHGRLTVEWTCNPYRVAKEAEGNQRWNDLNADLDVAQDTQFTVAGPSTLMLINASSELAQPSITTTGTVTININGTDIELVEGTTVPINQAYPLTLQAGVNFVTVGGTGTISFTWYKEVL